jgi:hypothetical protein
MSMEETEGGCVSRSFEDSPSESAPGAVVPCGSFPGKELDGVRIWDAALSRIESCSCSDREAAMRMKACPRRRPSMGALARGGSSTPNRRVRES